MKSVKRPAPAKHRLLFPISTFKLFQLPTCPACELVRSMTSFDTAVFDSRQGAMELVTGPPQLHATDVVAVVHPSGELGCSSFNVVVNNGAQGAVRASVEINGRATDLVMIRDQQAGCFVFPGGHLQPDPQLLLSLPLVRGRNRMEFRVDGGTSAFADLWLWSARDRIVVVDVDGTITKSDVRGLVASQLQSTTSFISNLNPWTQDIATALNTDYTHDGVADALTYIARCEYQLLYLTARPITLADQTRAFLASVGRLQNAAMPEGPLITQPHGTMKALQAKHEVFKIEVLSQIQELFCSSADGMHGSPSKSAPVAFAAGFGNHETDVMAYTAAAIPPTHIFVLDKASNLRIHACGTEVQSYTGLLHHLPVLFPPLRPADGPYFGSPGKEAPAYGATMLAREAAPSVNAAHASPMQDDRGGHNGASRRHAAPAAPKSWGGVSDLTGLWNFQEQPSHMRNSMESTANTVRASAREIMSNIIPGVRDLSCSKPIPRSAHGTTSPPHQPLGGSGASRPPKQQGLADEVGQQPYGVSPYADSQRLHPQHHGSPDSVLAAAQHGLVHRRHDDIQRGADRHPPRVVVHAQTHPGDRGYTGSQGVLREGTFAPFISPLPTREVDIQAEGARAQDVSSRKEREVEGG